MLTLTFLLFFPHGLLLLINQKKKDQINKATKQKSAHIRVVANLINFSFGSHVLETNQFGIMFTKL